MLEPNVLFKEFRFRSCLAQTQMEQLEEKVQEFRSFVKKAEERLQRIHEEAKIVMAGAGAIADGKWRLLGLFYAKDGRPQNRKCHEISDTATDCA